MKNIIVIEEDSIDVAVQVNATIIEFDESYSKEYFEERYKDKDKLILVAYVDNQPVGYAVAYDRNNDGSFYCWMAGVNPQFRRLGIMKKLMEYLNYWAKNEGYKKITIKTRNNRREMLAFLIKAGFNFIEVQPHPFTEDNRILLERIIT